MPSPRACPGCERVIAVDRGFSFDDKLNMICRSCGGKIVQVDDAASACTEENASVESEDEAVRGSV